VYYNIGIESKQAKKMNTSNNYVHPLSQGFSLVGAPVAVVPKMAISDIEDDIIDNDEVDSAIDEIIEFGSVEIFENGQGPDDEGDSTVITLEDCKAKAQEDYNSLCIEVVRLAAAILISKAAIDHGIQFEI